MGTPKHTYPEPTARPDTLLSIVTARVDIDVQRELAMFYDLFKEAFDGIPPSMSQVERIQSNAFRFAGLTWLIQYYDDGTASLWFQTPRTGTSHPVGTASGREQLRRVLEERSNP